MTRTDIIKAIAHRENLTVEQVEPVIDSFFDLIGTSLAGGQDVKLINFGKFEVRHRKPVRRRNPRTGAMIDVPAKTTLGFKPSPALKGRVNHQG